MLLGHRRLQCVLRISVARSCILDASSKSRFPGIKSAFNHLDRFCFWFCAASVILLRVLVFLLHRLGHNVRILGHCHPPCVIFCGLCDVFPVGVSLVLCLLLSSVICSNPLRCVMFPYHEFETLHSLCSHGCCCFRSKIKIHLRRHFCSEKLSLVSSKSLGPAH